ncbi:hypothetical protein [Streptomyces sp. NBC_01207]|uniref:hypothetical protein n=1 Tax=Streptomyces sp. NBC_01207 TaxID=2903772 RepID=UPI002E0ED03D|nr:hypothetical protein OG457_27345 [Streptomyces sp. NBC_01207]
MTNSATTATYAYAASGFAGRSRHQVRTDVFTANVLCGRPADRVLTDREAEKLRDCFRCAKARAGADAQAMHDAAMAAAAQAEDVEAPAVDAPAAAADEPAATVLATLPGLIEVSVEDDRPNTMFVTRRGEALGTVLDEGDWSTTRGRYAARTTRGAARRDGVVGFYATRDDAVAAIIATNPHAAPTHGLTAPQRRAYEMLAAGDGWTTKDRGITRQAFTGLVNKGLAKFSNNSPAFWGGNLLTADPVCPPRLADPVQAFADAMAEVDAEVEQETTGALFPAASPAVRRYTAADALLPVPPRTVAADAHRPAAVHVTLDDVDAGNRCVHGMTEEPIDLTRPAAACGRKGSGTSAGVFSEEGCVDTFDCAVLASLEARRLNDETGEDDHRWALICNDHDEQPADTCEDCAPDADEDAGTDENEEPLNDATAPAEKSTDRLYVEVETALAFPGYREDRFTLRSTGRADALEYVALPHDATRNQNVVLSAMGLAPLGRPEYIAGLNLDRVQAVRVNPADTPAVTELRAYLADEAAAWKVIGDHLNDYVAPLAPKDKAPAVHQLNPHRRPVLRQGDAYPLGWTFRVGYGDDATYAAVTRSGDTDGLTDFTTRDDAQAALLAGAPAPTFKEGDRVVCGDAVTRTVAGMTHRAGEPARVIVENGAEWIAADCARANPEDIDAARQAANAASARVTSDPDGTNPEWQEALKDLSDALDYLKAADPITRTALAEQDAAEAARTAVTKYHTAADKFEPVQTEGGELIGHTFQVGRLHAARYGWVDLGGVFPFSLVEYRSYASIDLAREGGHDRPAGPAALTEEAARRTASRNYPFANDFQPVTDPDGIVLAYTFRTTDNPHAGGYGWVRQDGTLAPITEPYREDLTRLLLSDHADRNRPALPSRQKNPARDAAQLVALRGLLTRLRVIEAMGDMGAVRQALGEYDAAMDSHDQR